MARGVDAVPGAVERARDGERRAHDPVSRGADTTIRGSQRLDVLTAPVGGVHTGAGRASDARARSGGGARRFSWTHRGHAATARGSTTAAPQARSTGAMKRFAIALLLVSAALSDRPARADAALDELKAGYALKQAGKCDEAIPHFERSVMVADSPKARLNLSDCQRQLHELMAARDNAARGQALAIEQHDPELAAVAKSQFAAIDAGLPHLRIALSSVAPSNATMSFDGAPWTSTSAEPANPGAHTIVVRAPGHTDRRYSIALAAAEERTVNVDVGPTNSASEPSTPTTDTTGAPSRAPAGAWSTQRTLALGVASAGIVGVAIGSGLGISAIGKNNASNANGHCDASGCDPTGVTLRHEALSQASASTIAFALGLSAVAGGIVLWATAPTEHATAVRVELRPIVQPTMAGAFIAGGW